MTQIHLSPQMFSPREETFIEAGVFHAALFQYPSGVCAVRISNDTGELVLLPFQGQQIWSAEFGGRNLTMKSMFDAPNATRSYLENYGGFLLHCGATAMGNPSSLDTHPLHGELPNAPFQKAHLELGRDENGDYVGLGGAYRHTVAFTCNYLAEPMVKLYQGSSLIRIQLAVTNLRKAAMEFMYLAHINFRPVSNARLVYSAICSPEAVRVRRNIPSNLKPDPGYPAFLEELAAHPERHHVLKPDLMFDPEVVFMIDYKTDEDGWAHSLQIHPNGEADYVGHRTAELNHAIRWISRTADQDALGLLLPATAEPDGYHAEKAKGNIKILKGGECYRCEIVTGALTAVEARAMEEKVDRIVAER